MLDWNSVELAINKEKLFLENNIQSSPFSQNDPIKCLDCLWRLIAILIVSGQIKCKKIYFDKKQAWQSFQGGDEDLGHKKHGTDWHNSTILNIKKYFELKRLVVDMEPVMAFGRADLGVKSLNLFLEIGTIGVYKLYINLLNIGNSKIVLIPGENFLIEFYGKKYRKNIK